MVKSKSLNEFLVYILIGAIFFSNFRTIAAHTTIIPFNGEKQFESLNEFFVYIFIV